MDSSLNLKFSEKTKSEERLIDINRVIIAGWTGRNASAMEAHIVELEELGVKRPERTPMFYRVAARRITSDDSIEVLGDTSSGEVEFVLLNVDGRIWVGVGSDHTDRQAETVGVTLSKQMCDKPIAAEFWPLDEVADHWDQLILRSQATINGQTSVYQEGSVVSMLDPRDLLARFDAENPDAAFESGNMMMGGTLPAIGGVRSAERFEFELVDPVLNRTIKHGYKTNELAVLG